MGSGRELFKKKLKGIYPSHSLPSLVRTMHEYSAALKPIVQSEYLEEYYPKTETISRDPTGKNHIFYDASINKPPSIKDSLKLITDLEKIRYLADIVAIKPPSPQ